jgi:hypothetical protein
VFDLGVRAEVLLARGQVEAGLRLWRRVVGGLTSAADPISRVSRSTWTRGSSRRGRSPWSPTPGMADSTHSKGDAAACRQGDAVHRAFQQRTGVDRGRC